MVLISPTNQWPAGALHEAIDSAARARAAELILAGAEPSAIDLNGIRDRVEMSWLENALPAGNA